MVAAEGRGGGSGWEKSGSWAGGWAHTGALGSGSAGTQGGVTGAWSPGWWGHRVCLALL